MLRKKCHDVLDQVSDERLEDALKLLAEMRDRKTNDYVTYMSGIPVYKMENKEHANRLLIESGLTPSKPKLIN